MGHGDNQAEYASLTGLMISEFRAAGIHGIFESVPEMRELSRTGPRIANIVLGLEKKIWKTHTMHYHKATKIET